MKVQLQDKDLQLLDEQFQKNQLQINALQKELARLKSEYQSLETARNQAIDALYKRAGVAKQAYDIDLIHHVLTPRAGPAK